MAGVHAQARRASRRLPGQGPPKRLTRRTIAPLARRRPARLIQRIGRARRRRQAKSRRGGTRRLPATRSRGRSGNRRPGRARASNGAAPGSRNRR
ncbi:hypothetical protein WU86_02625 [Corynebacterium xerosis]|nr:hypothetical protein WU86_02625 [Corynebacterium xerosis]